MFDAGGGYGHGSQRESAEAKVQQPSQSVTQRPRPSSLLCTVTPDICVLLVSSASSLIPIPPVSQWHERTSEVSVS